MRFSGFALLVPLIVSASFSAHAGGMPDPFAAANQAFSNLDYAMAYQLAMPAAEAGDARAQLLVGDLYSNGFGVSRNDDLAFTWFYRSAVQNDPMAQYALGSAYLSGQGAPQDDRQAFLWTEKAANQDLGVAVYRLSQMYRAGKGVKSDPGKARQFALKAEEIAEREMQDWPLAKANR